jgi:tetratricopeptide (TPR) repeat protein
MARWQPGAEVRVFAETGMPQFKYHAFISYSHADRAWGDWLHKALETYRIPTRLVGRTTAAGVVPKSLAPVFRDRDELPSATDLNAKVAEALAQSANLIVICSPRSAASRWVNEEILGFKRLGRADRVFCLIVDGEPNASDTSGREAEECFAPALRFILGSDGEPTVERTEPIAADARAGKDGKANARLKLISGLLDVGYDELRQRELQRRNRRMAAVTALALVVMAVTTALAISAVIARRSADVARQAAERRQKQAEHLVGFMLGDLNDKLAQVSRLDIMEAVDDQAMQYFQSLPTTDVTDEALAQRAKALEKIGNVRMDQGHLPAAMQAYQSSLKFAAALASAKPGDTGRQVAYARTMAFIGMAHWYQGQLDDALRTFRAAQAVLLQARSRAPADLNLRFELGTIDNDIGHVLESRGRFEEATAQYGGMLTLARDLVAAQPDNKDWAVQLGMAHNNLGKLALLRGDIETAITEYAADDAIESDLAARDPKDNTQRENLLLVRAILGRTLVLAGDTQGGMRDLRQAVDLATGLTAIEPNNTSFQEDLALYASQLARLLRLSGDMPGATARTEQSMAIFRALTRQDPANTSWQRELAEAQLEQSEQSRAAGRAGMAREQAQAALAILDPQLAKQPDDQPTLLAAIATRLLMADLTQPHDPAAATRQRKDALEALRTSKSRDPRLLALKVRALLAADANAEAQPAIQQLWRSGYRDPAFTGVLARAGIDYPINAAMQARLQAARQPARPAASSSSTAQE